MLPVTPRISSLPARLIAGLTLGGVVVLHAVAHLAMGDLFEGHARGLGVLTHLHLILGAAVQLAGALGGEDDEQVAVGYFLQRLLQGREHHSGTSTSGNLRVRRLVRERSAWMIVPNWSTASF